MRNFLCGLSLGCAFFFLGCSASHAELLDRVVAVVGDEPILQSDVLKLKKDVAATPALAGAYRLSPGETNFDKILDRMIEDKIIKQSVKELDIGVSDAEVENQISTIAKQNKLTLNQLGKSKKIRGNRQGGEFRKTFF